MTPTTQDVRKAIRHIAESLMGEGGHLDAEIEWEVEHIENSTPDGHDGWTIGIIGPEGIGLVITIEEGEANRSNRLEAETSAAQEADTASQLANEAAEEARIAPCTSSRHLDTASKASRAAAIAHRDAAVAHDVAAKAAEVEAARIETVGHD